MEVSTKQEERRGGNVESEEDDLPLQHNARCQTFLLNQGVALAWEGCSLPARHEPSQVECEDLQK
eukprot:scaffold153_cov347-Pavlova_lutheri.AAC.69